MSLYVFMKDDRLHLISAYESGEVILRRYAGEREVSIEGRNWECVWRTKQHNESGALDLDMAFHQALSSLQ